MNVDGVADLFQIPAAKIVNRVWRIDFGERPALFEHARHGAPIVDVCIDAHGADNDACGLREGDGRFAANLILFVKSAFGYEETVGFAQALDLVIIASFLIPYIFEQTEPFSMVIQGIVRQLALMILYLGSGHGRCNAFPREYNQY